MNFDEHIRRCYLSDFPDDGPITTADEARLVYRTGYLAGIKDGQHIGGETEALMAQRHAQKNFDRGYAQGIAYAAFSASHTLLPQTVFGSGDFKAQMAAAYAMRDLIVASLDAIAKTAKERV